MFGREIIRQEATVRRSRGKERGYAVRGLLEHPSSPKAPLQFVDIPFTRVLRDEDWLASRVKIIREAYHLGKEFVARIPGNPLWFLHPATRVLVLWPEWPCHIALFLLKKGCAE